MRATSFSLGLADGDAIGPRHAAGRQHWESTLRGIVVIAVLSLVVLASYGVAALRM